MIITSQNTFEKKKKKEFKFQSFVISKSKHKIINIDEIALIKPRGREIDGQIKSVP